MGTVTERIVNEFRSFWLEWTLIAIVLGVVVVAILALLASTSTDPMVGLVRQMDECMATEAFTREECMAIITADQGSSRTTIIPMPMVR